MDRNAEIINGSGLFGFLSKQNDDYKLEVIEWYNALPPRERGYVDTIRSEAVDEAVFFAENPEF